MPRGAETLDLDYAPPLDWPFFLRYLGARATAGVEAVDGGCYARTLEIDGEPGALAVSHHPTRPCLILTVRGPLRRHAPRVAGLVRRTFDLDADLEAVHAVLGADPWLKPSVDARPGLRVPGACSAFELLVRTVVGQQVAVRAASTVVGRIADRVGAPAADGPAGVERPRLFPTPRALADADLGGVGMPARRAGALQNLARAVADGAIPFPFPDPEADADGVREALLALPGIGPWTVSYFALRALRDPDASPGTDLVLRRSLAGSAAGAPDRWRPFRGYAAVHLWNRAAAEGPPRRDREPIGKR